MLSRDANSSSFQGFRDKGLEFRCMYMRAIVSAASRGLHMDYFGGYYRGYKKGY